MIVAFKLPLPPSVNHMYVGMGRHKSRFYKAWLKECGHLLPPGLVAHAPAARWELTVTCVMPNWRRRDLDNCVKPLIDFLAGQLGLEDNYLVAIAMIKEVAKGESYCTGEVRIV
jgi:Holliday junction resolvase RusA-like endonuclease